MTKVEKFGYSYCGFKNLDSRPGLFDICFVCFWEDDNIQKDDSNYRAGANDINLNDARQNYKK